MSSINLVMTPKVAPLFASIFLLLPFLSLSHLNGNEPKPFGFFQQLQGYSKGEHVKGLHKLKQYLSKFGYLKYEHSNDHTHEDEDKFDDLLDSAIKTYQLYYNLKVTGTLDAETVKQMMMPRCGVPDIVNGTTWMRSGKEKRYHHGSRLLHFSSHYAFFPGNPVWPADKANLTYGFIPSPKIDMLRTACAEAFKKWSMVSHFTFIEIPDYTYSDLRIGFFKGDHGDGYPFDGHGGVLAHAFPPPDGNFHVDEEENFVSEPNPVEIDIQTVALHEIGHLLGLAHSQEKAAVMYASIPLGKRKELYYDDIQGIKALYHL